MTRRGDEVEIRPLPSVNDRVAAFAGFLQCCPTGEVTTVTRTLDFRFAPWISWALDHRFERWLRRDVAEELERLRTVLEAGERGT